MEKKYVIGVDFGYEETAAWVVPLHTSMELEPYGRSLMIRRCKKTESDKKIDSVVYIGRDGSFAANEGECPDSTLNKEFKDKISNLSDDKKLAYKAFIKLVYKRIYELNKDILVQEGKESNFYFQIACPTNWEEKDKKEYIDFFNDALSEFGVYIDYIMDESDAVYFCFHSIYTLSYDEVVLLIDYGSSTIDYTVVMGGKKISDSSWSNTTLGASEIEKTILSFYISQNEEKFNSTCEKIEKILIANGCSSFVPIIPRLENEIRREKEYYYIENSAHFLASLNLWSFFGIEELQPYQFIVSCEIDEVIAEYKAAVHRSFKKLHEEILARTNGSPVTKILLNGVGSIMPWVAEYITEIFGQDVVIEEDSYAGYAIAKGIAYYAQKRIESLERLGIRTTGM